MSYFNLNRVTLIGRLTREPELRALPSGSNVCTLRIACNSARRDGESGFIERPNFFDVDVYGPAADNVSSYMHRGSRVAVDGRLEWREWETEEGHKRQAVNIVAEMVQFLDSPRSHGSANEQDAKGAEADGELAGVGAEGGGTF
jgi:single-strand DNA-binding protein